MRKLDRVLTPRMQESFSYIRAMTRFSWEVKALENDLGGFFSSIPYVFIDCFFWHLSFGLGCILVIYEVGITSGSRYHPGWLKPTYSLFPSAQFRLLRGERIPLLGEEWRMKWDLEYHLPWGNLRTSFPDRSEHRSGFSPGAFRRISSWQISWFWPFKILSRT